MRTHLRTMPADFRSARSITFPCADVEMVPVALVQVNDYNPNKVATPEMESLAASIATSGVTQPIVGFRSPEFEQRPVVDGFHRLVILRDVFGLTEVPMSFVRKDLAGRIASTVRHNKAKGEHQIEAMARLVGLLTAEGLGDEEIAVQLGMEGEEVLRLRQVSGTAEER